MVGATRRARPWSRLPSDPQRRDQCSAGEARPRSGVVGAAMNAGRIALSTSLAGTRPEPPCWLGACGAAGG